MSAKDEPLNRNGMTTKQRDDWNSRPVATKTLDLCACCKTLKEGVKERTNPFPWFKQTSCEQCFDTEAKNRESQHATIDPYDFYC